VTHNALVVLGILVGSGLLAGIVAILANSDVGQAIADAIRHNSGANEGAAVRRELEGMQASLEQVQGDVELLPSQLTDAHERLEFTERLLAAHREPGRLEP
jgi:hypothetical protein